MKTFAVKVEHLPKRFDAAEWLVLKCPLCGYIMGISDLQRRGGESIVCRGDGGTCGGHYYLRGDLLYLEGIIRQPVPAIR